MDSKVKMVHETLNIVWILPHNFKPERTNSNVSKAKYAMNEFRAF